jgi:hypothetical protein
MPSSKCDRASIVTNDESMPPDSWQPTFASLIDGLVAGQWRLLDCIRDRPVASGRDAVRRDGQSVSGAQLVHAL